MQWAFFANKIKKRRLPGCWFCTYAWLVFSRRLAAKRRDRSRVAAVAVREKRESARTHKQPHRALPSISILDSCQVTGPVGLEVVMAPPPLWALGGRTTRLGLGPTRRHRLGLLPLLILFIFINIHSEKYF